MRLFPLTYVDVADLDPNEQARERRSPIVETTSAAGDREEPGRRRNQ
jgi:hypothetical protein